MPDSASELRHERVGYLGPSDPNTLKPMTGLLSYRRCAKFVATHHDVSKLVREAQKFSINLPIIGKVSVPPPRQLAVYGVIGARRDRCRRMAGGDRLRAWSRRRQTRVRHHTRRTTGTTRLTGESAQGGLTQRGRLLLLMSSA